MFALTSVPAWADEDVGIAIPQVPRKSTITTKAKVKNPERSIRRDLEDDASSPDHQSEVLSEPISELGRANAIVGAQTGNKAVIIQQGSDNSSMVKQGGHDNDMLIDQTGAHNRSSEAQLGSHNHKIKIQNGQREEENSGDGEVK